jgi:replicative DNA helicase
MIDKKKSDKSSPQPQPLSPEILDRLPPHNDEAERGVLGSMLIDPEVCDEVIDLIKGHDFYAQAHQTLFSHIVEMHNDGVRIDVALLRERLIKTGDLEAVGGVVTLADIIQSVPHAANAMYYARIVKEKATLRALISASTQILRECYDTSQEPRELLARSEQAIFSILEREGSTEITRFEDVMHEAFARIDQRIADGGGITGIETGFIDLDRMLGGLHGAELLILAGRPSMGKTAVAANIAEHVAVKTKKGVLFVSLEMNKLELAERMMCSYARVNGHKLRNGNLGPDDHRKLVEKASSMFDSPLHIDDNPSRTMTEIAATARRLKRRGDLSLIIIDYLQLIEPDNSRDPRQEQVAKIARRLKVLARSLDVPVMCLAQLNRKAEETKDNRPRLSHLRESGSIEQDADVVMFVHREEYYATTEEEKARLKGQAELQVAKQRNGPTGDVKLAFLADYARFENFAEDAGGDVASEYAGYEFE